MSEVTFTDANFKKDVLESKGLVVVDFFADWCGPCKMMAPNIEKIAKEYAGKAVIGKLNVDDSGQTAMAYGIQSIPTIIFFKDGQPADSAIGFQSYEALKKKIDAHM